MGRKLRRKATFGMVGRYQAAQIGRQGLLNTPIISLLRRLEHRMESEMYVDRTYNGGR